MESVEYKGWKQNTKLSNGSVELIITQEVGPRVITYAPKGGENIFKNYGEQLGKGGEKDWQIRGGHRLWIAPESKDLTYYPDNAPVAATPLGKNGVRLTPPAETGIGFQKEMEVTLDPEGSHVRVVHRVKNIGTKPQTIAPWSLSVMDAGGFAVIPQPPPKGHGPAAWLPNRAMSLWTYTDLSDGRYYLGKKFFTLAQDKTKGATKLGLAHREKWVGYVRNGVLFVKTFRFQEGKTYPDGGVNFETFTNEDMLELESLGPMEVLAAGGSVEHVEDWYLFTGLPALKPSDEAGLESAVASKMGAIR